MRNFLIVVVVIIIAVNIFGFLFSDDDRIVTPTRESNEVQRQAPEGDEVTTEVSLEAGENIFKQDCGMCHGNEGQGGVGEELAANNDLKDTSHVIKRILKGNAPMPPFGDRFSDEEVAAVASFIRSSWGNNFGEVSTEEVKAER
jgi:mono/diheme cytochrome c family protein